VYGLGATLGTVAFNALLRAAQGDEHEFPLAAKAPHHAAKAKACIFLYMEGGPSHIDTFDPKPKLAELHLTEFARNDKLASAMSNGKRYFIKSPFQFRQAGQSGIWLNEHYVHLARLADELCIYRGCVGESIDHPAANFQMTTGNRVAGDPAIGSWVTYGLGTLNQNLPSFVVLPEVHFPQGGTANWSNGFLPAHFQGTSLRAKGSPILDLNPPAGVTTNSQRKNLDLLARLEGMHQENHPENRALAARLHTYELAFRMQAQIPDIIDIGRETKAMHSMYGIGEPDTDGFARRCLLARKLVESGVRFVQVYAGGWDSHDYIEKSHGARIKSVDKPIAALVRDLKERGLLEQTLIVCCGEFGRSPDNGMRDGGQRVGRDHNARAMTVWFAGGGIRAGQVVGATDEIGDRAVEVVHPIRDLHATFLHLLGLDDNKLTYFHAGRFKQLSQVGASVIKELIA
jgi:hypothetical protein